MTRYVYLLWRHTEYGTEDTVATLDRDAIEPLALERFDETDPEMLAALLARPDAELAAKERFADSDGHKLCGGWGGVHLQVCPLEESA